jgi:hypothetical protein
MRDALIIIMLWARMWVYRGTLYTLGPHHGPHCHTHVTHCRRADLLTLRANPPVCVRASHFRQCVGGSCGALSGK